jgi:hypothetical protein
MTLNEEFFSVGNIMNWLLGDLEPVMICRLVSMEIEVFWNRSRVFPVLQE